MRGSRDAAPLDVYSTTNMWANGSRHEDEGRVLECGYDVNCAVVAVLQDRIAKTSGKVQETNSVP